MCTRSPPSPKAVILTRPQHQADHWLAALSEAGIAALHCPLSRIEAYQQPVAAIACAADYDAWLLTSVNAVNAAVALGLSAQTALQLKIIVIAIGPTTAAQLRHYGFNPVLCAPAPYTSEALLNCQHIQSMNIRKWLIIKGEQGRTLLADTLLERGAQVDIAVVYRRQPLSLNLIRLREWLINYPHSAWIISSGDAFTQLNQQLPCDLRQLCQTQTFWVSSVRLAQQVKQAGFSQIAIAKSATLSDILTALIFSFSVRG